MGGGGESKQEKKEEKEIHQESHSFKSIYLYAVVGALCSGEQTARVGEGGSEKQSDTGAEWGHRIIFAPACYCCNSWNPLVLWLSSQSNDLLMPSPGIDSGCPDSYLDDFFPHYNHTTI